jgi:hypothetical protein
VSLRDDDLGIARSGFLDDLEPRETHPCYADGRNVVWIIEDISRLGLSSSAGNCDRVHSWRVFGKDQDSVLWAVGAGRKQDCSVVGARTFSLMGRVKPFEDAGFVEIALMAGY